MEIWTFILEAVNKGSKVTLLVVVDSSGSSPGRRGFKMAVDEHGRMCGSIGGGVMEHKFTEMARVDMLGKAGKVSIHKQVHSKEGGKNRSGMICSGEQTVAVVPVDADVASSIQRLVTALEHQENVELWLNQSGMILKTDHTLQEQYSFSSSEREWQYKEKIGHRETVHIIGGGHVGLALSELLHWLGYYIKLYDNRPNLNTFDDNTHVHEKHIVDFRELSSIIGDGSDYIVLVSFGYATDKLVLKQLIGRKFKYFGMMGSATKTQTLFRELAKEGIDQGFLKHIRAPIGVQINSQSPEEIAVSIAAEITMVRRQG